MRKPWTCSSLLFALALAFLSATPASALPDAQLLRISARGADFRGGARVRLELEIRPSGDAPLPSVPVTLTIDDEPYAEWKTPAGLPPQQTATWSLVWHARRGSFLFVAFVDPLNEVTEPDEVNNSVFINIGAGAAPEPSPWAAILAGLCAFVFAVVASFLFKRHLLRRGQRRKPSRPTRRPASHR